MIEGHAADQPDDKDDDKNNTENAAAAKPTVTTVSIVTAATTEKQHQQDNDPNYAYDLPSEFQIERLKIFDKTLPDQNRKIPTALIGVVHRRGKRQPSQCRQ
jgi:hypothetical protein